MNGKHQTSKKEKQINDQFYIQSSEQNGGADAQNRDFQQKKLDLAYQNGQNFLSPPKQIKPIIKQGMDDMSQRYQYRQFKMQDRAMKYLNKSIASKNQVLLNDIQNKKDGPNQAYLGDMIIQQYYQDQINYQVPQQYQNDKLQKQYAVTNIGDDADNLSQQQEDTQENTQNEQNQQNQDKIAFIANENKEFFDSLKKAQTIQERKQLNETDNQQFQTSTRQNVLKFQSSLVNKQKYQVEQSKFVKMKTNDFVDESTQIKNSVKQQSFYQFKKQETIQNAYLHSIFVSDSEEDESNENQKEEISQKGISETQSIGQGQAEDEKIQQKKKKKVQILKIKKDELTAIPNEQNTFQLTLKKGMRKNQGVYDNQNISIPFLPQSATHLKDFPSEQQIKSESKSNLNDLVTSQCKQNLSFLLNCSNLWNFSKITSLLLNFQYKRQDAKAYHKLSDFRCITFIGEGSYSTVDMFEYIPLKIPVAVKSVKSLEVFAKELYIMETLQSLYMPQLFFYDENQKKLFMELGLCSLDDLKKNSERTGVYLNDQQTFCLLNQLIVAIELMIEQKAFHSDIKPQNIAIRSKINEQNNIELQLMLIDYGASSFIPEDYWNYFTPAFTCNQLMNKLASSDSCFSKDISKDKSAQIQGLLDSIQESTEQEVSTINQNSIKLDQSMIKSVPVKKTNLGEIDKRQAYLNSNNPSFKSTNVSENLDALSSYKQQNSIQIQSQEQQQQIPYLKSETIFTNENTQSSNLKSQSILSSQKTQNFDKKYTLNYKETQSKQILLSDSEKCRSTIGNSNNQLSFSQQQSQSEYQNLKVTQQLVFDRNSEKNANDITFSWEEIRYSEIYAGCRSIQYLILNKNDEELFKKENIHDFFYKYHKEYPKTLKLMYKVFKKNKIYSLTKNQLNELFNKSTDEDFKLDSIDPNMVFQISTVKKQWDNIIKTQI